LPVKIHVQNDLICVEWDVRPAHTHSLTAITIRAHWMWNVWSGDIDYVDNLWLAD